MIEHLILLGGLITQQLGHVPRRGERIMINDRRIEVIGADGRRARLLRVNIVPNYN